MFLRYLGGGVGVTSSPTCRSNKFLLRRVSKGASYQLIGRELMHLRELSCKFADAPRPRILPALRGNALILIVSEFFFASLYVIRSSFNVNELAVFNS